MALEVRHNRAEHSHENFQFRRVAKKLIQLFDYKGWDGILIGNPDSEDFSRFRADAILLYNHGLVIIDLKNYQGNIQIPKKDTDFAITKWYSETEDDRQRIVIKGGNSFINPFMQLKSYRQVMYDIINSNHILKSNIDPSRIRAVNLFSGPIKLNRETPGSIPYYQITDEEGFNDYLYDINTPNTYSEESARALNLIFPASRWEEKIEIPENETRKPVINSIREDVECEIRTFLEKESNGILILESMEHTKRDDWVRYILAEAVNHGIPQTEIWSHSSRIKGKIKVRSGIQSHSLYKTIYGGKQKTKDDEVEGEQYEDEIGAREIVGIKSDDILDENGLIILHEAHLVTRSLNQSVLLRFGSGRLLEDLLKFLNLENTNRKLICIGDPFSLSYGKVSESALSMENLKEIFEGDISNFRETPFMEFSNPLEGLRGDLAKSIDEGCFNSLNYNFDSKILAENDKSQTLDVLKSWFSEPVTSEPLNSMLVYSNKDAQKINLYIKQHYLKNSSIIAQGDLLLMNNNISIPDETGLGVPTSITNGMYLLVKEILEEHVEVINSKSFKTPVELKFIRIKIRCLSLDNKPEATVWLSYNYFIGDDKLSKEEEIAFRVYINQQIAAYLKKHSFEDSEEYRKLQQDNRFLDHKRQIISLEKALENGEKIKTKLEKEKVELNKIEKSYRRDYRDFVQRKIYTENPYLNAVQSKYGWCITVHKAVGSRFQNIGINASQGENRGHTNEDYFRWLYSAITTASSKVNVLNPVSIHPLIDCRFVDTEQVGWNTTANHTELEFLDYIIPLELDSIMQVDMAHNVKSAISIFSSFVEDKGVLLERTLFNNQYLSKAFFSLPDDENNQLVIAFNSNGNEKVTSIRAERNGEFLNGGIEDAIEFIKSKTGESNEIEIEEFPNDFRREIYNKWFEKSKSNGADLCLIGGHNYDDIFIYSKGNEKIEFKVYFNDRCFITVIMVLRKSDTVISEDLNNLIFHD